jgi:hypothetical protein
VRRWRDSAAALLGVPTVARRQRTGDGGEQRLTGTETVAWRDGDGRAARDGDGPGRRRLRTAAVGMAARARRAIRAMAARARRSLSRGERRGRGGCRDARRVVPIAVLSRGIGAACGGHAATARCRAGPARRAASDRCSPLVSDF